MLVPYAASIQIKHERGKLYTPFCCVEVTTTSGAKWQGCHVNPTVQVKSPPGGNALDPSMQVVPQQ